MTNIGADAGAYATSIMEDRIDEFWQLVGYVGVLSFAVVGTTFALAAAARIAYHRKGAFRSKNI